MLILLVLFASLFLNAPAFAISPLPNKVLALYDREVEINILDTSIHNHAEVVLNHLGIDVVYQPIQNGLPPIEDLKDYLGILTWFPKVNSVKNPKGYCQWVQKGIQNGLKWVVLREPGFFIDKKRFLVDECHEMLKNFGVQYLGSFSDNPFYFEILHKDSAMVEFERKLILAEETHFSQYKVLNPTAKVFLKMRRRDNPGSESDLVFVNNKGGFVHATYVNYEIKELKKFQWRLNPFRFFEEAFAIKGRPRPDTTTLNGRRIFFSHIDGDGIVNISHIDNESYAGEIIYQEILKKYPTLPITASIITGYLDMRRYQNERVDKMYRDIFSLPNVEVASHGHAHPFNWKKHRLALKIPGYTYSDSKEIVGSVEKLKTLLKKLKISKDANLFLWTGDCDPTAEQLAIPYLASLKNLNGGNSIFDHAHNSYGYLSPLGILKGDFRQVFAPEVNDNVFTNGWKGPFYGFEKVIETFQNTEKPIRIKPINIYYHYFSGELAASITALKRAYDNASSQKIFPIFAGEYVPIVWDFFATEISRVGDGFHIRNRGFLKTIRLDDETRNVDWSRSQGILGFQHLQGSLYIFLDEAKEHTLFLTSAKPTRPYVREASFHIRNWSGSVNRMQFEKEGWFQSEIVLGGLFPHRAYRIEAKGDNFLLRSDGAGDLAIRFKQAENGAKPVSVAVTAQ